MDYQNYEDYMRQVLGYYPQNSNIYETYDDRNYQDYDNTYYRNEYVTSKAEDEMHDWYPEIYHLINPMVCKVCAENSQAITKELVEKMTDEIYTAIGDTETVVNVRIETPKETSREATNNITSNRREERMARTERTPRKLEESREIGTNRENKLTRTSRQENLENRESSNIDKSGNIESREVRETRRQNFTLRDLIKILILKQLGGNRPPRPPFPGGPGMPPPRPPFQGGTGTSLSRLSMGENNNATSMSRDYTDYLKF